MSYFHGVSARQVNSSALVPAVATSGVTFAIGTAPVQIVNGEMQVQKPVMVQSFRQAAATLGYSNNWQNYSLCEVMYSHFKVFATSPVFFVNVLDPAKHNTPVAATSYAVQDNKVLLPLEAIKSSVIVEGGTLTSDYELFYEGEYLVVAIDGAGALAGATSLTIGFDAVDPSKVDVAQVIGASAIDEKPATGLALVDAIFPTFGILPDILIAPGYSYKAGVAAVMDAKASDVNGLFKAISLVDVDTVAVKAISKVAEWKKANNVTGKNQALCYPMGKVGDKTFHLSSLMAALMAEVDTANGNCPAESPSNKKLRIDSTVLADGTEVRLDLVQANGLNEIGVVTAINFAGGFTLWGNELASYPETKAADQRFISVVRMFAWVANTVLCTYWSKVDGRLTRRMIDSVVDNANIWLNGLKSEEKILGGRIEYREEENPAAQLAAGKAVFHMFLAPAGPAQEIEFVIEYDAQYIKM